MFSLQVSHCPLNHAAIGILFTSRSSTVLPSRSSLPTCKRAFSTVNDHLYLQLLVIISVRATSVLFPIRLLPSGLYRIPSRSVNQRNKNAAKRLFPSLNEWFLVTKYNNIATVQSIPTYQHPDIPPVP